MPYVEFQGILLNVEWQKGRGLSSSDLPARPGIYAEVYWPTKGVRIGETGRSIRAKIQHDIRWFNAMRDGTAAPEQLRRTLPIAVAAKATGETGFEFYVVSDDDRLEDKLLRQSCEKFMFEWVRQCAKLTDWNRQISWR